MKVKLISFICTFYSDSLSFLEYIENNWYVNINKLTYYLILRRFVRRICMKSSSGSVLNANNNRDLLAVSITV